MPEFRLPDLGEGLERAEIVSWHVAVGDHVEVDQVVAEVETAKAVVEVPVPFAGTVATLHAEPGTSVEVGRPLITVAAADIEVVEVEGTEAEGFREPGAVTANSDSDSDNDSGNVLIGYGTGGHSTARRRTGSRRHRATSRTLHSVPLSTEIPAGAVPVLSPLVRRLAREAGVDVASLTGSGPARIVRRADVEAAMSSDVDAVVPPPGNEDGVRRIPLTGVRGVVAEKLSRSRREIPEATVWVDVDATELLAARTRLNATDAQRPVSLLALLARFTVLGLRRFTELNGRVEDDEIVIPGHVNLGFAAQTDRGLVVPVVRDADRMSTRELSAALAERTTAARAGRLTTADLTGGTVTVNNYGVFGVDGSAAIINHPEVAIVGVGRIVDRPWVVDGELRVRKVSQLTLAFDHRVCDGATAGGFLRYLADCVESPVTALGDL